jgi:hypothetical protein
LSIPLAAAPFFNLASYPVCLQDAAELLHFGAFPDRSAIVVIPAVDKAWKF